MQPKSPDNKIEPSQIARIRLLYFVLGIILLLGATEWLVRKNTSLFEGASQKMLTKSAMFEKKAKVDFVFFGTSRTQDGISPRLVSRRLLEISPTLGEKVGFNAATPGSHSEDLLAIAPRYFQNSNLRLVVIELSIAHLGSPPPVSQQTQAVEDTIAHSFQDLAFVRYRTAFVFENWGRFPTLLFSSSLVWNFAAQPMPESFFKDPSHLSRKLGRGHWSYALAHQLARKLESH